MVGTVEGRGSETRLDSEPSTFNGGGKSAAKGERVRNGGGDEEEEEKEMKQKQREREKENVLGGFGEVEVEVGVEGPTERPEGDEEVLIAEPLRLVLGTCKGALRKKS